METICGATFVFDHGGVPDLIENELTDGAYRVVVGRAPVGAGPPMHMHPHTDEGFDVGEGELTFVFHERELVAGPGHSPRPAPRRAHSAHHKAAARAAVYSPGDAEHITQPIKALLSDNCFEAVAVSAPPCPRYCVSREAQALTDHAEHGREHSPHGAAGRCGSCLALVAPGALGSPDDSV